MKVGGGAGMLTIPAPVAQMDRVLASEAKGRAFESRRARHFFPSIARCNALGYSRSCSILDTEC